MRKKKKKKKSYKKILMIYFQFKCDILNQTMTCIFSKLS